MADVNKLKTLKANFLSQRYELEDKVLKHYPAEIRYQEECIKGYAADIDHAAKNTPADKDAFTMSIKGTEYTEKKQAGYAIISACGAMTSPEPVPLGMYRGFYMELGYLSFSKEYQVFIKGALTYKVSLGTDVFGNITRIDNMIDGMAARQKECLERLENIAVQVEAAKAEMTVPFAREQELEDKSARLAELTIELKLTENDREILDDEPDERDNSVPRQRRDVERER